MSANRLLNLGIQRQSKAVRRNDELALCFGHFAPCSLPNIADLIDVIEDVARSGKLHARRLHAISTNSIAVKLIGAAI